MQAVVALSKLQEADEPDEDDEDEEDNPEQNVTQVLMDVLMHDPAAYVKIATALDREAPF
jgi:condensin complex subunit 3